MTSTITRRSLLASAPVAVADAAVPVAAVALPAPSENPRLLALGDELDAAQGAYNEARAVAAAAWEVWSPQWPATPEECIHGCYNNDGKKRDYEVGLDGYALGGAKARYIKTPEDMEKAIASSRVALAKDDARKRSWGKRCRQYLRDSIAAAERGLALLPVYRAECKRILRESRYRDLEYARFTAGKAIRDLTSKIFAEPVEGLSGVAIKAKAYAAVGNLVKVDRDGFLVEDLLMTRGTPMSVTLAEELLDVMGRADTAGV